MVKGDDTMIRLGLMAGMVSMVGLMGCIVSVHGQTVSNITFDGIGDSSTRVIFNVSSSFNGLQVRYGTGSCASGAGGAVQTNGTNMALVQLYGMTAQLSGLAPSTTYHVCPEVSSNGGASWSSGVDATFTTLARTQILPTPPATVSISFPEQTGSTLRVAANCSDLQAKINAAAPGDTIVIPAGTVCTGAYTTPTAPDAKAFRHTSVVTSKSAITIPGHRFVEDQEVHFSTLGVACLPGMGIFQANSVLYAYNCDKAGGWNKNSKYYVHVVDSSHIQILTAPGGLPAVPGWINFSADATADTITFVPSWATPGGFTTATGFSPNTPVQFVSNGSLPGGLSPDTTYFLLSACPPSPNAPCSSRVSLSPGGSAVNITSSGTGVHTLVDRGSGTMYIAPAPSQDGPWILIKTSGDLPPAGIRIDPSNDTQLFQLKKTTYDSTPVFVPGILAHNWRIQGALFNTANNNDSLTSTDPRPFCGGPSTNQDNRYIVFDQIRIQGPGYPNRFGCRSNAANMFWDGGYISIIHSDLRGLDFWHSWYGAATGVNAGGLVPTVVSFSQVTATAGVGHGGAFTTTLTGTTTINFTGGFASGPAYVYFAMDGSLQVLAPAGTSGNCLTTGASCSFLTAPSPNWPVDGNNRRAALALFTITLAAGSVTAVSPADPTTAFSGPVVREGSNAIIAGNGPGPYLISNNYFSGTGLTLHFDDGGGTLLDRGDYSVTNNTFDVPVTQQLLGPSSNGLWYGNRQPLEWKAGQRILVSGNIFQGCFSQVNNVGVCLAITPRSGGYVTDVDVTNNQFLNVDGASTLASPFDRYVPLSKPAARQRFSNNLALINAWTHYVPTETQPNGWFLYGGNAIEDVTISHNTIYDSRGQTNAFLYLVQHPIGGMSITDNIYFYTGDRAMFQGEIVAGCIPISTDKTMMDCAFTSGPASSSYSFTGNLIIPSWLNSATTSGFVGSSKVQNAFGSLASTNSIPVGASQSAVVALVNFASDYTLSRSSPYYTACSVKTPCGYTATRPLAAVPKINEVLNSASFWAGPVAPGQFVTIYGTDLGPTTPLTVALAADGKVSSLLKETAVLFNGFPAPLLYVRNDQINLVAPYEIAGATDLSVVVTLNGLASVPFPLTPARANPAVFTLDASGTGQGVILNPDNSINSPSNAAAKGSRIIIYVTGEGQTDPPGLTGKITAAPAPQPVLPVAAFINGSPTPTVYYGEATGVVAGMMQLNLRIPESTPSGELPLIVSVGDKPSQPGVTVSIQ